MGGEKKRSTRPEKRLEDSAVTNVLIGFTLFVFGLVLILNFTVVGYSAHKNVEIVGVSAA
jgi:hypothetical protein